MLLDTQQLFKLSDVVSQLRDQKTGASAHFFAHFGILGICFTLCLFKRGYGTTDEILFRITSRPVALAQHGEHAGQIDGIQIEDGGPLAAEAFSGIIAGKRQDVFDPHHRQLQGAAFHAHPVHVPAGKMDDDIHPQAEYFGPQRVWAERWVAAGIVRDGDR